MLKIMDRDRYAILGTFGMALVCGPISGIFVVRIVCHLRQRQWLLAGAWSVALAIMWGVMSFLTGTIVEFNMRGQ